MAGEGAQGAGQDADARERLRLAHQRLRRASQEIESLTTAPRMKGRWEPTPVPPDVLETARDSFERAVADVRRAHREVLGWEAPGRP